MKCSKLSIVHIYILGLCLSVAGLLSCAQQPTPLETILKNTNTVIIDVRTTDEFQQGHIDDALHIEYNDIDANITTNIPDINTPIVVYCRSGKRAEIAKTTLTKLGYTQVINAGGYTHLDKQIKSL